MKILLLLLGIISLSLGVIGIFLPILPTTPLLLLAAWCFFRSSEKLYDKLINSKHLGSYIKNFRENKIIPLKTKVYIIVMLWASLIYCIFFVTEGMLWLQIILGIILIGVTIHILSYKSRQLFGLRVKAQGLRVRKAVTLRLFNFPFESHTSV